MHCLYRVSLIDYPLGGICIHIITAQRSFAFTPAMFALDPRGLTGLDYKIILIVLGSVTAFAIAAAVIGFFSAQCTRKRTPHSSNSGHMQLAKPRRSYPILARNDIEAQVNDIIERRNSKMVASRVFRKQELDMYKSHAPPSYQQH